MISTMLNGPFFKIGLSLVGVSLLLGGVPVASLMKARSLGKKIKSSEAELKSIKEAEKNEKEAAIYKKRLKAFKQARKSRAKENNKK